MHVVATAGHVDHGKSTLVDALTGMQSDRLDEERRRGLSIELGFVWTDLPEVGEVAFVDVPGHERFITTMLAGIGSVPAVLFVVAADDPWMPQAAEHLAALDAVGVSHGVVAVTRCDLADPTDAVQRAAHELGRTTLRGAAIVPVSARTGAGLAELRSHLATMVGTLPTPDARADVRLWIDRRFTVKGTGTVITGTLSAGRVARGDELHVSGTTIRVRGVQSLGRPVDAAAGVARVALNITGDGLDDLGRGSVLCTPGAWHHTDVLDVRVRQTGGTVEGPAPHVQLHIGSASVAARTRPLDGHRAPDLFRLQLERTLPLRVGDRIVLREPGTRALWGATVLDPLPPGLRRRGAGVARARELISLGGEPDPGSEVTRRGLVDDETLRRIGVPLPAGPSAGGVRAGSWWLSPARAERLRHQLLQIVTEHDAAVPLDPGVPVPALAERLDLPSPKLLLALVPASLRVVGGRVRTAAATGLPGDVERAVSLVEDDLERSPFAAPTADRLSQIGLDARRAGAAAKAGRLWVVAPGIVLLPGADRLAARLLADLPQPFTTSEARQRLDTSRRVALPLLDALDRAGMTRRLPDDRREVC